MTDAGAPTPWWDQAHAASFRPGSVRPSPAQPVPLQAGRPQAGPGAGWSVRRRLVAQAGRRSRAGWSGAAQAGPAQPGPARLGVPPAYQPPVVDAPPPGTGALSLGLGRGSRERELIRQVGAPLAGTRRVVVLSIKGGVGKTTTVAVAGSLLAGLRRDKVVALDASSDWGTLATRLSVVPRQSVRELAANGRHAVSERGVLAQLAAAPSGLLVVGSDPQTLVSGGPPRRSTSRRCGCWSTSATSSSPTSAPGCSSRSCRPRWPAATSWSSPARRPGTPRRVPAPRWTGWPPAGSGRWSSAASSW